MVKMIEGQLDAKGKKFGLIVSRFNEFISKELLDGAIDCLKRHWAKDDDIDIIWVPGAFEMPLLAKKIANAKKYNALICLGAIIKGGTLHFDYVASESSKGIANVSLEEEIHVIFGVLTTDDIEQAIERAGTKAGNKGWQAAIHAIEMADLVGQMK